MEISRRLQSQGCASFAVSNIDEAKELRECGITGEIICLGYIPANSFDLVKRFSVIPMIYDGPSYRCVRDDGCGCYIKIDTGMCRLGFNPDDEILTEILTDDKTEIIGAMTHFSVADSNTAEDINYTKMQIEKFSAATKRLKDKCPDIKLFTCNSAAMITYPQLFDGARCGIALYGINPSENVIIKGLMPVMTVKAVISSVKVLKAGDYVSYGRKYRVDKKTKIAVITAGYADGLRRALSGKGCVNINGKYAPILGRVTMDQTVVDVSDIDCKTGDEVILFGDAPTAEEVAKTADTIPYEITCGISKRVPRIYTD